MWLQVGLRSRGLVCVFQESAHVQSNVHEVSKLGRCWYVFHEQVYTTLQAVVFRCKKTISEQFQLSTVRMQALYKPRGYSTFFDEYVRCRQLCYGILEKEATDLWTVFQQEATDLWTVFQPQQIYLWKNKRFKYRYTVTWSVYFDVCTHDIHVCVHTCVYIHTYIHTTYIHT